MGQSDSRSDGTTELNEARTRRDKLISALLAMNGGNADLYADIGRNEGYDSLLCALRSEDAVIESLSKAEDTGSDTA